MKTITALFSIVLLAGCVIRSPVIEEDFDDFLLSGSPCIDGVMENLNARCDSISIEDYNLNNHITSVKCVGPTYSTELDYLYYGYTNSEFLFLTTEYNSSELPENSHFFCIDTAVITTYILSL